MKNKKASKKEEPSNNSQGEVVGPSFANQYGKAKNGTLTPEPWELEEISFSLPRALMMYVIIYFLIIFPIIFIHQETVRPGGLVNSWIRLYVYNQGNLHDYLADDVLNQPFDAEVPYCDWQNMTEKQFFNEYVRTHRPCLFKGYGKL